MKIEELKEDLDEVCRDNYYQDLHDLSPGQLALFGLKDEILALVEVVENNFVGLGYQSYEDKLLKSALDAFNAKLESL